MIRSRKASVVATEVWTVTLQEALTVELNWL